MVNQNRKQHEVKFATGAGERALIFNIAARAWNDLQAARHHDKFLQHDIAMDISATHANGCPLRLKDLLEADAFNFAHDILGIRTHLDRNTGQLSDMFTPRFRA